MTTQQEPPMELVALRGGPLDGMRRHVHRTSAQARFMHPQRLSWHTYRRDAQGVWRHAGATP